MKISIIGPVYPYRGGIAHHTTLLNKTLLDNGINTQIISFSKQYPSWLYPGKNDKDPSEQKLLVNAEFILNPFYPWTWQKAIQQIRDFGPDAVIIQWWTTFWAIPFAFVAKSLHRIGVNVIFLVHNVLPHEPKPWDKYLTYLALKHNQLFIIQSHQEKEILEKLCPAAQIEYCPHPIYSILSENHISKDKARKKLEIPESKFVLLFFGIIRKYKGLNILIESLKKVSDKLVNWHLIIAGEFWVDKQNIIQQIEKAKLKKNITIIDRYIPNEDISLYFSTADVLVAPYTQGTQSGAVNIALGYQLPVITTKHIADNIPNEFRFLVRSVPPNDPSALAKEIINLANNITISENIISQSTGYQWQIVNSINLLVQ